MKFIEGYTPSKGLLMVIMFLACNMAIQLYQVTQVGSVEIVGNSIESDLITVSMFVSYAITMISLLFILSEFFLMRKMEAMFSVGELKAIGNTKREDLITEVEIVAEPDLEVEETEVMDIIEPEEDEDDDPFSDLLSSVEEEEVDEIEEDPSDNKYKVLGIKLPEQEESEDEEEEDVILVPDPGYDLGHVSIDSFVVKQDDPVILVPEEPEEPEYVFDQSEIIQTITELKDVVEELKKRTGRA